MGDAAGDDEEAISAALGPGVLGDSTEAVAPRAEAGATTLAEEAAVFEVSRELQPDEAATHASTAWKAT
jgi:hypothetical protein